MGAACGSKWTVLCHRTVTRRVVVEAVNSISERVPIRDRPDFSLVLIAESGWHLKRICGGRWWTACRGCRQHRMSYSMNCWFSGIERCLIHEQRDAFMSLYRRKARTGIGGMTATADGGRVGGVSGICAWMWGCEGWHAVVWAGQSVMRAGIRLDMIGDVRVDLSTRRTFPDLHRA